MQAISWCHNYSIFNFHQKSLIDGKKERKKCLDMKKFNRFKKHFPKLSSGEILKKIKKNR